MIDTPVLPDVTNMPELYLYGATMLQVQVWELALATLRFAVGVDPARAPKKLEREVARSIKQGWHFYRKATARRTSRVCKTRSTRIRTCLPRWER